jgi:hypothetical protein
MHQCNSDKIAEVVFISKNNVGLFWEEIGNHQLVWCGLIQHSTTDCRMRWSVFLEDLNRAISTVIKILTFEKEVVIVGPTFYNLPIVID